MNVAPVAMAQGVQQRAFIVFVRFRKYLIASRMVVHEAEYERFVFTSTKQSPQIFELKCNMGRRTAGYPLILKRNDFDRDITVRLRERAMLTMESAKKNGCSSFVTVRMEIQILTKLTLL